MRHLNEDNDAIRSYLLGYLSEAENALLEERIFAESAFAEEVEISEQELLSEYAAGGLTEKERSQVEAKYSTTNANRATLAFAEIFSDFVRSKSAAAGELSPQPRPSAAGIDQGFGLLKSPAGSRARWFSRRLGSYPVFAYAAVVTGLLLSAVLIWYLAYHRLLPGQPPDQRQLMEAELALLNKPGSPRPESTRSIVSLQPAQRYRGVMTRIAADPSTQVGLVDFRLSVTQGEARQCRAVFFDDQRHELFTISDLAAESSSRGPEVQMLVPLRYFKLGDYQIELSFANSAGEFTEATDSYAFRVVDVRP